jgi:hypothetical protein
MGQGVGLAGDELLPQRNLFGVGAFGGHFANRENRVAGTEVARALAHRRDHAREVAARNVRQRHFGRILARAHLPVGRVDACGVDIDQDFARSGNRVGKLPVLQHFRRTVATEEGGFHARNPTK